MKQCGLFTLLRVLLDAYTGRRKVNSSLCGFWDRKGSSLKQEPLGDFEASSVGQRGSLTCRSR